MNVVILVFNGLPFFVCYLQLYMYEKEIILINCETKKRFKIGLSKIITQFLINKGFEVSLEISFIYYSKKCL